MSRVTQILDVLFADVCRPRVSIHWSAARIQNLRDMANNVAPPRSPLDDKVAAAILLCVDGQFAKAETEVVRLMRDKADLIRQDGETFISVMFALYVLQHFGLLAALLHDRFGFNGEFSINVEESGPGIGRVRWEISPAGVHRFVFDAKSYAYDKTRDDILAFYWAFPMYANFSFSNYKEHGAIIINQMDVGHTPGLCWSDNRPDYFLVPDCIFVPTRGYEFARDVLTQNLVPWEDRKEVAFWRGGTTGIPRVRDDWRTLERVELCEIAKRHEHLGFLDIGLSSVLQIADPAAAESVKNSGLLRGFVPWEQWGQFKYQIDIDGNSSPWSNLFQRLLTGSAVLKVESSRGLNQWYYDELKPWVNYVPIAPDMSDLIDKIEWLRKNDGFAKAVGNAGRALAMSLTYERELGRSAHTIARCLRYFQGEVGASGPFGREWPHDAPDGGC
jgi:hypothetical protein